MKNRSHCGAFLLVMAIAAIAPQGQALAVRWHEPGHLLALQTRCSQSGTRQFATFDEQPGTEVRAIRIAASESLRTGKGSEMPVVDDARMGRPNLQSQDPKRNQTIQVLNNILKKKKPGQNAINNSR